MFLNLFLPWTHQLMGPPWVYFMYDPLLDLTQDLPLNLAEFPLWITDPRSTAVQLHWAL